MSLVKIKFTRLKITTLCSSVGLKFERWQLHIKTSLPICQSPLICSNKKPPITSLINRVMSLLVIKQSSVLCFAATQKLTRTNYFLSRRSVDNARLTMYNFCHMSDCFFKAQFRRSTFHEPNLINWSRYMKSLASESIRNACFNLEWLSRSFRLAQPGISPLERLWKGFDSDAELFMYRT